MLLEKWMSVSTEANDKNVYFVAYKFLRFYIPKYIYWIISLYRNLLQAWNSIGAICLNYTSTNLHIPSVCLFFFSTRCLLEFHVRTLIDLRDWSIFIVVFLGQLIFSVCLVLFLLSPYIFAAHASFFFSLLSALRAPLVLSLSLSFSHELVCPCTQKTEE